MTSPIETIREAFENLLATVRGECPSLLNTDSGGSEVLADQCDAALAALAQLESAMQLATDEIPEECIDAARGVMQAVRNIPGVTMERVYDHFVLRGDDMALWPKWALNYSGYVTEAAATRLVCDIVHAAGAGCERRRG
jgi:hypothetical protein